jgi:hypothetical protein
MKYHEIFDHLGRPHYKRCARFDWDGVAIIAVVAAWILVVMVVFK